MSVKDQSGPGKDALTISILPFSSVSLMINTFNANYVNSSKQLITKGKAIFQHNKSFVLIGKKENLYDAKRLMKQYSLNLNNCINKNGSMDETVIVWNYNARQRRPLEFVLSKSYVLFNTKTQKNHG